MEVLVPTLVILFVAAAAYRFLVWTNNRTETSLGTIAPFRRENTDIGKTNPSRRSQETWQPPESLRAEIVDRMSRFRSVPTVVIAHHQKVMADTLALVLNNMGYHAVPAYSGNAALKEVLSTKPKAAILCIVPTTPSDLNGVSAAMQVTTLLPDCKVLLFTGGSGDWVTQPLEYAKSKGFQFTVLDDPFAVEEILKALDEIFLLTPEIVQTDKRKRILLMDDHEILARLSCEILEMQNYCAIPIYNAAYVVDVVKRGSFDLVVTDHNHEGSNGTELARMIHEVKPEIPVVLVSGNPPAQISSDFAAFIPKEQMFPELLEVIQGNLGELTPRNEKRKEVGGGEES